MNSSSELFTVMDDLYEPTPEEEAEYWNGKGFITFYVIQNTPDVFEIEIEDWAGCAGGLDETMGIAWCIEHWWCLQKEETLKEGVSYTLHGLTSHWTRGDGWEIDDDVKYDFEEMTSSWKLTTRIRQKLSNWWWRSIGWRLR
jgi:hypothetical protein